MALGLREMGLRSGFGFTSAAGAGFGVTSFFGSAFLLSITLRLLASLVLLAGVACGDGLRGALRSFSFTSPFFLFSIVFLGVEGPGKLTVEIEMVVRKTFKK